MPLLRVAAVILVAGSVSASASAGPAASFACRAATVHYAPYSGGAPGLGQLPWIAGMPAKPGLVGLIWYWPRAWRDARVSGARIWPKGASPGGARSTKILWVFLSNAAKRSYGGGRLIVTGHRLDGPGRTWQSFGGVAYAGQDGAPSFASIVKLPSEGCWRLDLAAGGLKASVVVRAVSA